VSIFVDGHIDAHRAQPWKPPEDLGDEELEGEYDSIFDEIEREALEELAPRCRSIC